LKFGSQDGPYLKLPDSTSVKEISNKWLIALNEDLKTIREISTKFQAELIAVRTATTPPEEQNMFQPGDLVLFQLNPNNKKPSKLSSSFLGPFEVLKQSKNDVTCRHVSMGNIKVYHVTTLKLFSGTPEEAYTAAIQDGDQFVIEKITQWRGYPEK
jgi:hypothetical protein